MKKNSKPHIFAWPASLSDQDAARHLSLDTAIFKIATREHRVNPVTIGGVERRSRKRDNQTIEAIANEICKELIGAEGANSKVQLESIGDALDLLEVGVSTVYHLLEDGALTRKKVSGEPSPGEPASQDC